MRPPAWALRGAALALAVTGCGPHPANDAGQRAATAAARGIEALTHALPRIELHFGDDLRVDVLTSELAVVGSSYSEVQTDAHGQERTERGYFTAVAEHHQGHWRFRDAHWSSQP